MADYPVIVWAWLFAFLSTTAGFLCLGYGIGLSKRAAEERKKQDERAVSLDGRAVSLDERAEKLRVESEAVKTELFRGKNAAAIIIVETYQAIYDDYSDDVARLGRVKEILRIEKLSLSKFYRLRNKVEEFKRNQVKT